MEHEFVDLAELRLEPAEERAGLHRLPLFDGPLQIVDELLLLRDEFRRDARDAGAQRPVCPGAVQTIQLFGGLLEPFRQRGDELFSLGQLRFQRVHAFLHCSCFTDVEKRQHDSVAHNAEGTGDLPRGLRKGRRIRDQSVRS